MGRLNYQVGDRINPFYAVPVGTILPFAGSSIPAGWLECAGQALSRATYPDLFAVIGTTYGAATSETFNLPDLRGEFLRGWDNGRGADPGRVIGSWQADELKSHSHETIGTVAAAGGSAYGVPGAGASRWITTAAGGSETRPRNVAVRFCIRAFGSIENSGLIDVGALAVEVSGAVKIGDFIGGNQSKAESGYQKLPGGLIVQWGKVSTTSITDDRQAIFPVAFPNMVLSYSLCVTGAGDLIAVASGGTNVSINGIRTYADANRATNGVYWIAIGY